MEPNQTSIAQQREDQKRAVSAQQERSKRLYAKTSTAIGAWQMRVIELEILNDELSAAVEEMQRQIAQLKERPEAAQDESNSASAQDIVSSDAKRAA